MVQNPLRNVARYTQFRHEGSTRSSKIARFPVGQRRRLTGALKRCQPFDRDTNHSRANALNRVVQLIGQAPGDLVVISRAPTDPISGEVWADPSCCRRDRVRQDQGNSRAAMADPDALRRSTTRPGTVRTSSAHFPPASTRMRAPWSGAPNGPYRSNGAVPDAARVGKVGFVAGAMLVVLGYGILPWMTAVGAGLLIVSGVAVEG